MSVKALQDYTLYAKYAHYKPELHRRETWKEIVDRVFDMHALKYKDALDASEEFRSDFEFAKTQVLKKRVLGSQRALQFGGDPILEKNAKIYNCCVSYVDRSRAFQEIMYLLLCGCGVGFSVQHQHVAKLPKIHERSKGSRTFIVPDSIEGWADAIGIAVNSFFSPENSEFPLFSGYDVEFDYSEIRPEGAPIRGGFTAPGHKGLQNSINKIVELISTRIAQGETSLRPIDVYDIIMHSSDAVLSGGVRRSATICIFSKNDTEMIKAKTGDWYITNPQRGRSNNSALLIRNQTTREEFAELMKSVREFGEPGFVWAESDEILFNPCFQKDTRILTSNGYERIEDMYRSGKPFKAQTDMRVSKNDISMLNRGIIEYDATAVQLTQKQADIYKVTTEHGIEISTTSNHTFITTTGRVQLKDLKIGDTLLIQSEEGSFGSIGSYDEGLILGLLVGDGTLPKYSNNQSARICLWGDDCKDYENILKRIQKITGNHNITGRTSYQGDVEYISIESIDILKHYVELGCSPDTIKDRVPECVWKGTRDMVIGYLHGLIYTDGSVPRQKNENTASCFSIEITQSNHTLLLEVQKLLSMFAIVSRVYRLGKDDDFNELGLRESMLPDSHGNLSSYMCKRASKLSINRPNMIHFESEIGLFGRKAEILRSVLDNRGRVCRKPERYISKVKSIEFDTVDDVYCFTQHETNSTIANGIVIGQCVEIGMAPFLSSTRQSGVQFCNLCEMNGKKIRNEKEFLQACRAAAIIGTLQAGYSEFPYLGNITEQIVKEEALLGVSLTGWMDQPEILFDPKIQKKGAKQILETNEKIAKFIGINSAARTTCVKPAGTTSCILGTSSGIHPHHSRRYIRRVQANKLEFPVRYFEKINPLAVEDSVWSTNKTDKVISFLCEVESGAIVKNQIAAIDLLEKVKLTQQNWVEHGTRPERCTVKDMRHNVSNTITVKDDEWDDVEKYIYQNRKWFAGISLLPFSGDLDYPQAPFTAVHTPREIVDMYGSSAVFASGLIVDGHKAFDHNLWAACDCALGIGEELKPLKNAPVKPEIPLINDYDNQSDFIDDINSYTLDLYIWVDEVKQHDKLFLKHDWIRRAHQFANRYFEGNVRKMTHCLKDCYNWKQWCDLQREYQPIDWSDVQEETESLVSIDTIGAQACAGGKCSVSLEI